MWTQAAHGTSDATSEKVLLYFRDLLDSVSEEILIVINGNIFKYYKFLFFYIKSKFNWHVFIYALISHTLCNMNYENETDILGVYYICKM